MTANLIGNAMNSVNVAQKAVSSSSQNALATDGSTQIQTLVQNNGLSGPSVVTRRVESPFQFQQTITELAKEGASGAVFDYNSKLNTLLGETKDPNSIVNILQTFTTSFNAATPNAQAKRSNILLSANNFTTQVTSYVNGLSATKATLETDITNSVHNVNSIIRQLVSINKSIGSNGSKAYALLDQRDSLICKLGEYVAIKYSFDANGAATIQAANSEFLVTNLNYVQVDYTQDLNLLSHDPASDMMSISYHNLDGKSIHIAPVQVNDVIKLYGGRVAGLLDVRNNVLPAALKSINTTAQQIAFQIDELQNSGSGFPPSSSFTSQNTMLTTDQAAFTGRVNIAVTDNQGNPIKGSDGNFLKPLDIDFDKLTNTNAISGQFAVQDVINEINAVAAGPSQASIGLGQVSTPNGAAQAWLVDQVRLVPTSNISANGNMTFQLELDSGSDANVQFKVLGMTVYNDAGGVVGGQVVPSSTIFNLAAGQNSKTGQNISALLNGADQFNTIRLEMQVIGSNGVIDTKFADFIVGSTGVAQLAGSTVMNQRSEAAQSRAVVGVANVNPTQPILAAGATATATAARTGSPLFNARLVDANGNVITSPNTPGYFKISAVGGQGLVIASDTTKPCKVVPTNSTSTTLPENFSHWFELNNFFTADPVNPASNISVNPTIAANQNAISLGQAQVKTVTTQGNVMIGQTLPSATLDLNGGNAAGGDTVDINGTIFTFYAPPAPAPAVNPVIIGATSAASIQNLYQAVNANAALKATISVTPPPGGNGLTIVATTAGATVTVDSLINGFNEWKVSAANQLAGAAPGQEVTQLISGTASAQIDLFGNHPGDIVTINGIPFTIDIGGEAALLATLNQSTNPLIAGLVTFSLNGDILTATATQAGSAGNNIQVAATIGGVAADWTNPTTGFEDENATTHLIGGVDIQSTASINSYALEIGPDTSGIFQQLATHSFTFLSNDGNSTSQQTIASFFQTSFQNVMTQMYQTSETTYEVDAATLLQSEIAYDNLTKATKDNITSREMIFLDFIEHSKMLMNICAKLFENKDYLIQVMA